MKKNWVRWAAPLIITVVFLYFFLRKVEWKVVIESLTDVDPLFFTLSILLSTLHLITRAVRWKYLLIPEKKGVKFFHLFAGNALGFTVTSVFPGRLGEIVKPLYLAQKERMRPGFVLGTVVVERIFDILAMCFLLGIFLLANSVKSSIFEINQGASSHLYFWGKIGFIFAAGMLLASLTLYFFKEKALRGASFILRPFPARLSKKILSLLREFIDGLKFFHSVGRLLTYAALSVIVWCGIIFFYWIFFMAYHIRVPFSALIPYVFLTMIGASIPTPGMIGGFDYFSRLALTSMFHIESSRAVALTIVVHAVQTIMMVIVGYAVLWKEGTSLVQIKKLGENKADAPE